MALNGVDNQRVARVGTGRRQGLRSTIYLTSQSTPLGYLTHRRSALESVGFINIKVGHLTEFVASILGRDIFMGRNFVGVRHLHSFRGEFGILASPLLVWRRPY